MNDAQNLKSSIDLITVASGLGCLPPQRGLIYQGGKCPTGHESQGGKCFTIYPGTQSAYCFHCGGSWDVIGVVQEVKGLDFLGACNWLSDKYGLPYLETSSMSPEERAAHEARREEERVVYAILTEGARYYHNTLMADEEMKKHLIDHYGLSEETITTYALGYSGGEGLLEYLRVFGFSVEAITSTGLFVRGGGTWKEFFNQRLIFPYWKNGQVVYFIGRKTTRTHDDAWELGKYKKLPIKDDERRPYISDVIQNRWFYGEDSLRGHDRGFVAEGVTDCLAMLQAGYPTISPVTTRFREQDFPRLEKITRHANVVYLVPDNEKNQAGLNGAIDTGTTLEGASKSTYIVTIPRPEGVEKVDATDFLRDHGREAFDRLVKQAKTPLQLEIDEIGKENLDLIQLAERLSPIKKRLARIPQDTAMGYLDYMKKALKVKSDYVQAIKKEIKTLSKGSAEVSEDNGRVTPSALFPELVDLVIKDGQIEYLYKSEEGLQVDSSFVNQSGVRLVPPGREAIPFDLLPVDAILSLIHI